MYSSPCPARTVGTTTPVRDSEPKGVSEGISSRSNNCKSTGNLIPHPREANELAGERYARHSSPEITRLVGAEEEVLIDADDIIHTDSTTGKTDLFIGGWVLDFG